MDSSEHDHPHGHGRGHGHAHDHAAHGHDADGLAELLELDASVFGGLLDQAVAVAVEHAPTPTRVVVGVGTRVRASVRTSVRAPVRVGVGPGVPGVRLVVVVGVRRHASTVGQQCVAGIDSFA